MTYHLSRHLLINKYLVSFTPLGQIPSIMGIFFILSNKTGGVHFIFNSYSLDNRTKEYS